MTPDRWQRVKDVFSAASALDEPQRDGYLDEACAGDAELRAEVASLLDAHNHADAIVDRPAAAYVHSSALFAGVDRRIGQRVGPYEIVALIGHGGMGEVYRARRVDAQYDKEVAIKLVPGGYQRDFVLQRLRAERQILANLDHPDIARLIDGGATDEGLPYLVMELVEGEPLDRYCDGAQSVRARATATLSRRLCGRELRASAPRGSPRSEAQQHPRDGGRPREAAGLRHREAPAAGVYRDGHGADGHAHAGAHAGVREPRADSRRHHYHRERRVFARRRAVPAAHRPQPLSNRARLRARRNTRSLRDRSRAAERACGASGSRPRRDHFTSAAQRAGQALSLGRSALRRHPSTSRRSAGHGAWRSIQLSRRKVRAPAQDRDRCRSCARRHAARWRVRVTAGGTHRRPAARIGRAAKRARGAPFLQRPQARRHFRVPGARRDQGSAGLDRRA